MKINLTEVADKLKSAQKIIITAHVSPDGDAIGSSLALMQILKGYNKDVDIFIDDAIPFKFDILPYSKTLKHLTDNQEKIKADLLVILDTQIDRVGHVAEIVEAPILNIDHHITNEGEGVDWLFLNHKAAATCEIIYELTKILQCELTLDIAHCLYAGLATDTGFFNYANTKPSTLRAAADLIELGVKPNVIAEEMERKSLADFKGLAETLKTVEFFFNGKVSGLFVSEEIAHLVDSTEGIIDLIRVIDGVEIAFLLTCKSKDLCRVSMRSRTIDVSAIARNLGGGGHIRAAGCSIGAPFMIAKQILLKEIEKAIIESK